MSTSCAVDSRGRLVISWRCRSREREITEIASFSINREVSVRFTLLREHIGSVMRLA